MFHHLSSDEHNIRTPIVCIASNCELAFALLLHASVAHDRARFVFHWKSMRVITSLVFCCIQCRTRALAVSRISGKRLSAFATERSRTVVLPAPRTCHELVYLLTPQRLHFIHPGEVSGHTCALPPTISRQQPTQRIANWPLNCGTSSTNC